MSKMKSKFNLCVLTLPQDFKYQIGETHNKLLAKKFIDLTPSQEFGCGWVHPEDMFKTNFSMQELIVSDCIIGGYRYDKKSVPAALVKKLFKEKIKEREEELGGRLEKTDKQILKEECKDLLLLKALPNPKMIQWIWNMEDNTIFLDVKSPKIIDEFISLFNATFGVNVQRKNYGVQDENVSSFLDWVWQQSPSTEDQWVDKGITLDADSNIFKFSGPTLEAFIKEIEVMREGKKVKEICIGCKLGNNDYYIKFNSKNLIVAVESTNKIKYESLDAAVLDRVDIATLVVEKIETLIKSYLK